jgi:hypothetical protein
MRRRRNVSAVAGALLGIGGVVTYFLLVLRHDPRLRGLLDAPILHLGVVGTGIGLSLLGIRQARAHGGRILAPVLAVLNVGVAALFLWFLFVHTARLPEAARAPAIGAVAPDFSLRDQADHEVRLSSLRGHPVVLLFYRGFW